MPSKTNKQPTEAAPAEINMSGSGSQPQSLEPNKTSHLNNTQRAALMGGGIVAVGMVLLLAVTTVGAQMSRVHFASPIMSERRLEFERGENGGGMRGHHSRPAFGKVTKIDGNTLTLTDDDNNTVTVKVDDSTVYVKDGNTAKLSDIKTNDQLAVVGTMKDNVLTAKHIAINPDFAGPMSASPQADDSRATQPSDL